MRLVIYVAELFANQDKCTVHILPVSNHSSHDVNFSRKIALILKEETETFGFKAK